MTVGFRRRDRERSGSQAAIMRCTSAASGTLLSRSRSSRSDSISAISDRISRWRWVAASGTSRKISSDTGSSSGASKAIGWRTRSTAASGFFRPLILPCGMATPWPSPVEPSRSRANRLSVTVARAIACWFSNSRPACSNARFLLVASTSTRTSTAGRMAARRFMRVAPAAAESSGPAEVTKR